MNLNDNKPCENPLTCDSFKKTMVDILGKISIPSESEHFHSDTNQLKKTNRLVCCEEGWRYMGVGAEIVATVIDEAFDYLDAPPARVHQADVPLPYAANLEALSLPGTEDIVKAAKAVCEGI